MKTKSKSAQIREAIKTGSKPQAIANRLGVPVNYVYNEKYKMKKEAKKVGRRKKVVLRESEVQIAKALKIPLETYAKEKLKMEQEENKNSEISLEQEIYIDDLMEIRKQINNLQVIEAFLQVRIQQMGQNTKWQTKAQ